MGPHEQTVADTLKALADTDTRLQAVATLAGDAAVAESRHRDALASAGVSLGPLHGVPVVIKDIIDVAGLATRAGSATRPNPAPAQADATVVAKLRAAGAIVAAKAKTVEFAFGGWGTNESQGTPRNPYAEEPSTPGGSSSGTGALVGARLVPAGLGTDTGGSVRIPAAFCGTVGLKTSLGLVSRAGVVPLSRTLDSVGPLTDTVARAAEMLAAMQGQDPADPSTRGAPHVDPFAGLARGIDGLTLGVVAPDQLDSMEADVAAAFDRDCQLLEGLGARLVPFRFPKTFLAMQTDATRIITTDAYAEHHTLVDNETAPLNPITRKRILMGKNVSARERIAAERTRERDTADFLAAMDRVDAIILPTSPVLPRPIAKVDEDDYAMSLFTRFANYLDLAALSVPSGVSKGGLPTALQFAVRRFEDPLALRIGAAYEAARAPLPAPSLLAPAPAG